MSIDSEKLTKFLTKLESIDNLLKKYKISSNTIDNYTSNNVEKLHEIAEVIPTDNTVILSEHEFNTVIKKSSVSKIIEFNNSEKSRETTNDYNQVDHIDDIKKIKKSENSDKVYQINIDDLKTLKENSIYKEHSKYIAKPLSYHYIMLYAIVKSIHTLFGVNIQQHTIEDTQQEGGGFFDRITGIFNPTAGKSGDGEQDNVGKDNDDEQGKNVEKPSDGEQGNNVGKASDGEQYSDDLNDDKKPNDGEKDDGEKEMIDYERVGDDEKEMIDDERVGDDVNVDTNEVNPEIGDDEETNSVKGIDIEDTNDTDYEFSYVNDTTQSGIEEISSESLFFSIRSLLTTIKDSEVSTQQEKFIEFLKENIEDTDNNKILGIYDVYNIYTKNKELFDSENTDKKLIEKIDRLDELLKSINEKYKNIKSVKDTNYTSNYDKLYKDIDDIINPKTTFSVTHIRDQYISKIKEQLNLLILDNKKVKKDSIYYNSLKYLLTNNKLYDILININIVIIDFNIEILEKLESIIDKFIKSIKQEKKADESQYNESLNESSNESSNEFKDFTSIGDTNTNDTAMDVNNIKRAISVLPQDEAEEVKQHMENLSGNTNSESIKSEQQDEQQEEQGEQREQGEQEPEEPDKQELEEQQQEKITNVEEEGEQKDKKPETGGKTRLYIKDKGLKKSKRRIKRSINNRRKIKKNTKKIDLKK